MAAGTRPRRGEEGRIDGKRSQLRRYWRKSVKRGGGPTGQGGDSKKSSGAFCENVGSEKGEGMIGKERRKEEGKVWVRARK